ncbi:hypothetical protein INT43_003524 [Umbelopsis isabellina]|uniref:Transcription factor TFIIIC triple barrel domain-containing protein n=1 Tax=Mortierella isabellina TaxID=91625 RepID=A0A8H7PQK5_MORIS|nr:hypothetical protein INT43_003524 [Umbelopsis isabellina]
MSSSDDELLTETQYIILDVGDTVSDDIIESAQASGGCSLVGLDTPTPFLQLGTDVYQGQHDETIGTRGVAIEEDDDYKLQYVASTTKTIQFRKVELTKKDPTARDTATKPEATEPEWELTQFKHYTPPTQ